MKKYIVVRDNHGFQGRYWVKDTVVEFENDVVPSRHFRLMDTKEEEQKVNEELANEQIALSQVQRKEVKPLPTAGEVMKKQKRVGK